MTIPVILDICKKYMYLQYFLLASLTKRHKQKLNSSFCATSKNTGTVLKFSKSVSCFQSSAIGPFSPNIHKKHFFVTFSLEFSQSSSFIFENKSSLVSKMLFNSWLKSRSNDMVFFVKNEQKLTSFE